MTRNEFKEQAKWAIIEKLEEGYDGYLCDQHHEVFNTEMYETNTAKATRILDGLGSYSVVAETVKYEQGIFGQTSVEKYSDPCLVLSMLWYMVGQEAISELAEDVPECDELWDEELTEDGCLVVIDRFKKKMEEEGE